MIKKVPQCEAVVTFADLHSGPTFALAGMFSFKAAPVELAIKKE